MSTSTPILDAFNTALAQFCGTPAAQLGGRIRWTGTPEQVAALRSEIMGAPGGTMPATAADGGPVLYHARLHCGQWMNVDLYAHPNGGGFSIDAEPAEPALTHPVAPVLISFDVSSEVRDLAAGLRELCTAASELSAALPPANDVDAQARETIADLLAEARRPYTHPNEKATLVGAAAQLLAALK